MSGDNRKGAPLLAHHRKESLQPLFLPTLQMSHWFKQTNKKTKLKCSFLYINPSHPSEDYIGVATMWLVWKFGVKHSHCRTVPLQRWICPQAGRWKDLSITEIDCIIKYGSSKKRPNEDRRRASKMCFNKFMRLDGGRKAGRIREGMQ